MRGISLSDLLVTIGEYAFCQCRKLDGLTIPDTVTSIGKNAFYGCNNIAHTNYHGCEEQLSKIVDGSVGDIPGRICYIRGADDTVIQTGKCGADITFILHQSGLLVLSGSGPMHPYGDGAYVVASNPPWHENRGIIKRVLFNGNITSICEKAFWECRKLSSIELPDSVSVIRENAFYGCDRLRSVTLPSLISINEGAFDGCTSLIGGAGTAYNDEQVDKTLAHADGGTSKPGYLTLNLPANTVVGKGDYWTAYYLDGVKV